jgi:predicted DsbA family dithiol-disulfide isomerase
MKKNQNDVLLNLDQRFPENMTAPILQAAKKKMEDEAKERQIAAAIDNLKRVEENTRAAVMALRAARKEEKRAETFLKAVAAAETEFVKTGDFSKYNVAMALAATMATRR